MLMAIMLATSIATKDTNFKGTLNNGAEKEVSTSLELLEMILAATDEPRQR